MAKSAYYFETKAIVHYSRPVWFRAVPLAKQVVAKLDGSGYSFDPRGYFTTNEMQLQSDDHILSICIDETRPREIAVAVETPERSYDDDALRAERFRICVAATRFVLDTMPAEKVHWTHLNNYYVTEKGQITARGTLMPADPNLRPRTKEIAPFIKLGLNFVNSMFEKTRTLELARLQKTG